MSFEIRPTVLVVDDDEIGRELVGRKLDKACRVLTAADGAEALECVAAGDVDLVVLDVMMPGMDGYAVCRKIKEESGGRFLPVILLTALHDQDDINRGLAAGADEFLTKPVDTRELRLRTSALLRVREQERTILRQRRELEQANAALQAHSERLEEAVRVRTEDLRTQHRLLRQIVDSLPVSLYVVDRDKKVVAWNRKRELGRLGVPREEALGRSLFDLFKSKPRQLVERELDEIFESGKDVAFEVDSKRDGEQRSYRLVRVPMRLTGGEVSHVLTLGEDITDRKRLHASLALSQKMGAVGRLAAGVAHEVNNPLATIVTCAGALKSRTESFPEDFDGREEIVEYLDIMEQEAFRAKRIGEGLLDFSRTQPADRIDCRLERVVERTLRVLRHHDGFKRVEVGYRFADGVPDVHIEEDALVQVLVALMLNALDAMPDGGRIDLETRTDGASVFCHVRDTGVGITAERMPMIFDPFYTTKPAGRGTGLGLAVCYGIMQAHDGRIDVQSVPGEGSCFTLTLPAARAARAREAAS